MTENKDQNLKQNASLLFSAGKSILEKVGEKSVQASMAFFNDPAGSTEKIAQAIKNTGKEAAKFAINTGINLVTEPSKAVQTGLGLLERSLNAIPGVGGFFSFITGTAKDAWMDRKLEALSTNINLVKEGLETLADATGKALEGLRGEMEKGLAELGARQDQLEGMQQAFAEAQGKINAHLQSQVDELKQKTDKLERDTEKNKESIWREQMKLNSLRDEFKDQIKETKVEIKNLRQEQEELAQDQEKFKAKVEERSARTEQAFEDLESDYTRRNKIIDTKIAENEERLDDYAEGLVNVEYQQKMMNVQQEEILEELETQNDLIWEQKHRLDFVVNEIEEITDEINQRMNKLQREQLDQEEKIEEALFTANRATRKVEDLAEDLKKHNRKIENLQEQIERNKLETKQAKAEAERANERIDNLLKNQQLLDHSKEQQTLDKIQKTLELKADEAKLLADLEIISKTQKLITKPAEREWRVGIKEGKEKDIPRPEGMPLNPNSRWAKTFTPEQLREWGWDTRLLGEHETAPLTDPEKRKPEEAQPQEGQKPQETEQAEQEKKEKQSESLREIIEETKTNILAQLTEIQQQINENITPLETEIQEASDSSSDSEPETTQNQIEEQEAEIRQQRALAKAQLGRQQRKQQELKQARTQTKSALTKEQNKLAKIEQSLSQETNPAKKQQLQALQKQSEEKITELQEQLEKQEQQFSQQQQKVEETEKTVQEKNKQIEKLQQQKPQITPQKLEKELKEQEKELNQAQQEVLQHQFEQIKESEEQILETPDVPPPPAQEIKEKLEEAQEAAAAQAAPQKSMSLYMLYFIIFLLEYIVYKRNGLPGLVILNICLVIAYYNKDQIMEYQHLWDKYVLIIGYVMGNVLTYNAVEKPEHKMPAVIGFNAILALIYGYTWWQNRKTTNQIIETKQKEIQQLTTEYAEKVIQYETERVDALQQAQENLEKIKQTQLNTIPIATVFAKHNLQDLHQRVSSWRKEEKKEDNIFEMPTNLTSATPQVTQLSHLQVFSNTIEQVTQPSEEEEKLLKKLSKLLTANQLLAISSQAPEKMPSLSKFTEPLESKKIKKLERELAEITQHSDISFLKEQIETISEELKQARETTAFSKYFGSLPNNQKLRLFNLGLNALEINTLEKKNNLIQILSQINQEQQTFDLSIQEKENILRLITSKVSEEQSKVYEEYGIPLYNASNWVITEEQKENLLKIELGKVKVSEEEIKNRKLSVRNQNIVRVLAPLKRDYKHSLELRAKIQKLGLKSKHLSYLIQQEIISDINLAFGEIKEPFKQLEKSIIEKEQKKIFKEQQEFEKEETKKRTQEIGEKLLPNLLEFAQTNLEELNNYELTLYHSEKTCWVSVGAIDYYQSIYLNIQGFKSKADYLFFDLLIFAFNSFGSVEEYDTNWEKWKDIEPIFTEELVQIWQKWGITYEQAKEWLDACSLRSIGEHCAKFYAWLKKENWTPERTLNEGNLDELWKNFEEVEGSLVPLNQKQLNWNQLLDKYSLIPTWEEYLELVKEREAERLEKRAKFLAGQQAKSQGQVSSPSANIEALEEKYDRLAGIYEQLSNYINSGQSEQTATSQPSTSQEQPQTQQSNSRYDELLSNLSTEEAERQRKKLQRQEAKKKLEETERKRREDALSEKDRKLKEDEERRQQEKELEAQEAERKKKAQEAREQELRENRESYLSNQATRIEEAKKRAEEALENERKKMELEKQRREAEIEELKKDTEKELQRIEQEKQLFEQEKEEKLRAIDAEDKEARQRIEKEFEEVKIKLEEKARKKSQEVEKELNKRKQELTEKENENKIEIERLKKSADLADQEYQQLKQSRAERTAAQESERQRKRLAEEENRKDRRDKMSLEGIHKQAMRYVRGYFPFEDEFNSSVQGASWATHSDGTFFTVGEWFSRGARINVAGFIGLEHGTSRRVIKGTSTPWVYTYGRQLARVVNYVGSGFYSESELEQKIKESMTDPNIFN